MPYCDHNYLKYYSLKKEDVILDLGASLGEYEKEKYLDFEPQSMLYCTKK